MRKLIYDGQLHREWGGGIVLCSYEQRCAGNFIVEVRDSEADERAAPATLNFYAPKRLAKKCQFHADGMEIPGRRRCIRRISNSSRTTVHLTASVKGEAFADSGRSPARTTV